MLWITCLAYAGFTSLSPIAGVGAIYACTRAVLDTWG